MSKGSARLAINGLCLNSSMLPGWSLLQGVAMAEEPGEEDTGGDATAMAMRISFSLRREQQVGERREESGAVAVQTARALKGRRESRPRR
jgi:hypothetical protein